VLDHVGDVRPFTVDAGLGQRLVEHAAGGADERRPRDVLLVAGLLADEHPARRHRSLAEDSLGRARPQVTRPAAGGGLADLRRIGAPSQHRIVDGLGQGGLLVGGDGLHVHARIVVPSR
jgi:hypothetical protein